MKHQMITSQMLLKMAVMLMVIAFVNFGLSHFFLKERLHTYMENGLVEKKQLIYELAKLSIEPGEKEPFPELNQLFEDIIASNKDVDQIAMFPLDHNLFHTNALAGTYELIGYEEELIRETEWVVSQEYDSTGKLDGTTYKTYVLPVYNDYLLVIGMNLGEQSSLEWLIIFVDVSVTIFTMLVILLVINYLSKRQLKPLGEIERYLTKVAEGDFTRRLPQSKDNEFSWLIERINHMVEKINELIQEVKDKADNKVAHMAFHDDLTDLPNRRKFRERLKEEILYAKKQKKQFAVLYLDLDGFKKINDTLGHGYGDRLLIKIAKRLNKAIGNEGTLFRLGGDEFTVLVRFYNQNQINQLCERIINDFEKSFELYGDEVAISISIGIANFPAGGRSHDLLLRNADAAMYQAKKRGKKQFVFYEQHMSEDLLERIEIERHLRIALEKEELHLHYQPQVNAATGEMKGVEVLLRWYHEEFGMVPPSKFIPVIEKTTLINDVGEWVLTHACRQNKKWQDDGIGYFPISVNVSARQFQQANLVGSVENALRKSGLDANYLTIEITESTAMDNIQESFEKMTALKKLGVRVAIDDFGTGHSSLRYLKSFPIDLLKIDREFVKDVGNKDSGMEIVSAIIALAHSLKLGIVAEGVETEQQLRFLKEKQCFLIQGFIYSKPLSASDFIDWYIKQQKVLIN